ncbi:hypothetical protein R1flu_029004 [Riccia fluitans]|uniref:Uncharacterized protein n=1 Tax=Riccia fluitans TaxID=41844 RepID=A0ABD1XNC2_9MARC
MSVHLFVASPANRELDAESFLDVTIGFSTFQSFLKFLGERCEQRAGCRELHGCHDQILHFRSSLKFLGERCEPRAGCRELHGCHDRILHFRSFLVKIEVCSTSIASSSSSSILRLLSFNFRLVSVQISASITGNCNWTISDHCNKFFS